MIWKSPKSRRRAIAIIFLHPVISLYRLAFSYKSFSVVSFSQRELHEYSNALVHTTTFSYKSFSVASFSHLELFVYSYSRAHPTRSSYRLRSVVSSLCDLCCITCPQFLARISSYHCSIYNFSYVAYHMYRNTCIFSSFALLEKLISGKVNFIEFYYFFLLYTIQ